MKNKKIKNNDWIFHYPGKTITDNEHSLFCLMTMNHHPIHIDKEFAKKTKFRKQLVVGTYIFSLVVGMTVRDISIKAEANLNYSKINHLRPTFIGDTIYAKSKIISIKNTKSKKYKILNVQTIARNQHKLKILEFYREILFKKND